MDKTLVGKVISDKPYRLYDGDVIEKVYEIDGVEYVEDMYTGNLRKYDIVKDGRIFESADELYRVLKLEDNREQRFRQDIGEQKAELISYVERHQGLSKFHLHQIKTMVNRILDRYEDAEHEFNSDRATLRRYERGTAMWVHECENCTRDCSNCPAWLGFEHEYDPDGVFAKFGNNDEFRRHTAEKQRHIKHRSFKTKKR